MKKIIFALAFCGILTGTIFGARKFKVDFKINPPVLPAKNEQTDFQIELEDQQIAQHGIEEAVRARLNKMLDFFESYKPEYLTILKINEIVAPKTFRVWFKIDPIGTGRIRLGDRLIKIEQDEIAKLGGVDAAVKAKLLGMLEFDQFYTPERLVIKEIKEMNANDLKQYEAEKERDRRIFGF